MLSERFHVYELLDALSRGGPGRCHLGRVVDAGGPLAPGTQVVLRAVGLDEVGDERTFAQLVETHAMARRGAGDRVVTPADHGVSVCGGVREFWAVSPWVEGRTLADVLRGTDVVPDPLAEAILRDAVAAVSSVHAAGLFGIGLTPDSILLRTDGSAVLVDTGFGPATRARWPATGRPPAAMMCAAPEVIAGTTPDARADLYALGAILYRMMTGRWHRPEDARALNLQSEEMDAARPNDERPKCSLFLSEVAYALLRADRDARVGSAADLTAILRDRRSGTWWQGLHIDQDTHDDEPAARRTHPQEPAPTPIPEAAPKPGEDWWSQRVTDPGPFASHLGRCVGRDAEVGLLVQEALGLADGKGRVVLVQGPEGCGKTRVLDAFLARLRELPAHRRPFVLRGEHRRTGIGRPLGAFTEALTRFLHDDRVADAADVAPLLGEAAGVASAFAAVVSSEAPPAGVPQLAAASVPATILRCLSTIAARAQVVLVVEDLQWADPEVLALFSYVARVGGTLPLLLVGSFRAPEGQDALAEMTAEVRAIPGQREIVLGPLGADRLVPLARELVSPAGAADDLARAVLGSAEPTPGTLVEAIRCLEAEGHLARRADGVFEAQVTLATAALPASASDAAARRFAALSDRERAFLASAVVQGVAFDSDVARIASGLDARAAARVLETLAARGLLSGDGVARRFTSCRVFDHVRAGLDDLALRDRHEATAAAFLESRNPDQLPPSRIHGILSYRVAWHYLLSGRAARGLLYIEAAIDHLRGTCRHGDGERLTALATRVVGSDGSRGGEQIDLLLDRSRFLAAQGRVAEQREVLAEALRRSRERRDLLRESRVLHDTAMTHALFGEAAAADQDARQALACAHRAGGVEVESRIHVWLAQTAFRESRWQDSRAHWTEALEIARRQQNATGEAEAHHGLGLVGQSMGAFDEAEESFLTAIRAYRRQGDLPREAESLACLGSLTAAGGDLVQAEGCLRRALAIHVALGDGAGETRVLGLLAMVLQEGGCLVEAREAHRACHDRARRLDSRQSEVVALLNLATADGFLGRLDEARDSYGEALRGARQLEDARLQGYALTGLGEVARQRGEIDIARGLFERAVQQFRLTQDPGGLAASLLAWGRLETIAARNDDAGQLLTEAHHLADQQNARQVTAVTQSLLAVLAARRGDSDEAERRVVESGLALSDIRATDATRVETLFLHSLVLRVVGRTAEAGRKILQTEAILLESVRGLPDGDRERVLASLTPNREVVAGADATRATLLSRVPDASDTVQV